MWGDRAAEQHEQDQPSEWAIEGLTDEEADRFMAALGELHPNTTDEGTHDHEDQDED